VKGSRPSWDDRINSIAGKSAGIQPEEAGIMATKHAELLDTIGGMTVLELSEFVEAFKEKFNVTAVAAPMAMPGGGGGEAAAAVEEKDEFTVVLTGSGEKKIQVIKVVRELTGLGLKEAKDLVDGIPGTVKEGVTKQEAEQMKAKLEEVGATVTLK
jgi:large subunit ribosomal protein L7/L12